MTYPLLVRSAKMAEYLQISDRTLRHWADKGAVPCVWVGAHRRYSPEAVFAALGVVQPRGAEERS